MLRRPRLNLIRVTLGALAVLALGAALVPAPGFATSRAASSRVAPQPPTLAQLQARADRASKQAGAARQLADRAAIAAASAAANLRDAEATLAGLAEMVPTVSPLIAPSPPQDYAVAAAQNRLQLAQQQAFQAEAAANLSRLAAPPGGLAGSPALLDNIARQQARNTQSTVFTAQRSLAAAQQSASIATQATNLSVSLGNARLRSAQRAVAAARRLAVTTANAARTADRNAQTLAEAADRARAAANAAGTSSTQAR